MEKKFPSKFAGAGPTASFCQAINIVFDILNSTRKYGKTELQNSISQENFEKVEKKALELIDYIKSLKVINSNREVSILKSKRKTGIYCWVERSSFFVSILIHK